MHVYINATPEEFKKLAVLSEADKDPIIPVNDKLSMDVAKKQQRILDFLDRHFITYATAFDKADKIIPLRVKLHELALDYADAKLKKENDDNEVNQTFWTNLLKEKMTINKSLKGNSNEI